MIMVSPLLKRRCVSRAVRKFGATLSFLARVSGNCVEKYASLGVHFCLFCSCILGLIHLVVLQTLDLLRQKTNHMHKDHRELFLRIEITLSFLAIGFGFVHTIWYE